PGVGPGSGTPGSSRRLEPMMSRSQMVIANNPDFQNLLSTYVFLNLRSPKRHAGNFWECRKHLGLSINKKLSL
ncbi:MAG: hypothetical protein V2I33_25430, partial [Kangiellaceae bacterium]|nr:hypothetical protein [Kangiellaceae bacterium]